MASTLRSWKDFPSLVLRLPFPQKLIILIALLVAGAAITATLTLEFSRPIPLEKSSATAAIAIENANLFEDKSVGSNVIMPLARGVKVNLLDPVNLSEDFVKIQAILPRRNSKPGYVQTAALSDWASDNPASAWAIVGLSRPKGNSDDSAIRRFLDQLKAFEQRFPKTPPCDQSALERANLLIDLASRQKIIGTPREEWARDVSAAKDALASVPTTALAEAQRNEMARMEKEIAALEEGAPTTPAAAKPPTAPPAAPVKPEVAEKVRGLLRSAQLAWDGGDLNACERYANQALALAPDSTTAKGFLFQVKQARDALRD
ncbi:MAG: hypothetical protein HY820_26135 [Acidobacteria bacterium]|nr:hypothetical protein [Acidobacteriota bacterium]